MGTEATPSDNACRDTAVLLLLKRSRSLYADLCDELERADPEDNKYCLLLSNCADDLDSFMSGMDRLWEVRS